MKIHRIICLVVDPNHPDTPAEEYASLLENCRHVNPTILSIESAEIGEWDDDHPLNRTATKAEAVAAAFAPPTPTDYATRQARANELRKQIRALEEQFSALPAVFEAWSLVKPGFWCRDNYDIDYAGAEIERVSDGYDWSLSTGESGTAPTLDAAKEAADTAAKAKGVILR